MYIYSCDLGGTNTKWGIFNKDILIEHGEFKSHASNGGQALLDTLKAHIYNIVERKRFLLLFWVTHHIVFKEKHVFSFNDGFTINVAHGDAITQGIFFKELQNSLDIITFFFHVSADAFT